MTSQVTAKEEGELTASDEEVQPMRGPLTQQVSVPSTNPNIQNPQPGNSGLLTKPVNAAPSKVTHSKKQAVVSVTAIHGKKVPVRSDKNNDNLVINFSDDDTGSESDSKGRAKVQPKGTVFGNRNPPTLVQTKLKGPRKIDNRLVTNKALPASTFSHKVTNFSSAGETISKKNSHTFQRKVGKDTQMVEPNRNELLDLRQQIALRENELKLKAVQTKKDTVNPEMRPVRRLSMVSDGGKQVESNEPPKKRLKVSGVDTSLAVVNYLEPASVAAPMKAPSTSKSLQLGNNANASCKHVERSSDKIDPPVISQNIVEGNTSSSGLQKNASKSKHYEVVRYGQPEVSVHVTSKELETTRNVDGGSSGQLLRIGNGNHQPCLNNSGLWNIPGNTTATCHSQPGMLSLANLEESLDRELEEAQERRYLCEIEERNALKVYRKAQRSLIEATARCAELYSKRENLSAQYGSLIVNDSRFVVQPGSGFHFLNSNTETTDLATKTDLLQHTQLESNHRYNNQYGSSHPLPRSRSGQNLGSEPCSDHDASTSDGLPCSKKQTTSRLCSPSSDANMLLDGESSPVDHESTGGNLGHQAESLEKTLGNQNSLLREASLRSKLFERLGMRAESRGDTCSNGETATDRGDESDVASERTQRDHSSPLSENFQHNDSREPEAHKLQRSHSETPVEPGAVEQYSLNLQSSTDMESHPSEPPVERGAMEQNSLNLQSSMYIESHPSETPVERGAIEQNSLNLQSSIDMESHPSEPPVKRAGIEENPVNLQSNRDIESHRVSPGDDLLSSVALPGPSFRSTIDHLKVPGSSITSLGPEYALPNKSFILHNDERQCRSLTETTAHEKIMGSYTCNLKVDPFRPLCMYELRGRCNNDECLWQHFKDFSDDSLHQSLNDSPDDGSASILHSKNQHSARGSQLSDVVLPPTYLVCLDMIKVDSWSYESVLSQRHGQVWWKHFSVCLASSNSLQKNIPARENEGRIEVLGNSRTHSSYFRTKHSLMNLLKQGSDAAVEPVEMALIIFCREVDQSEGLIQALTVLSRGLEGHPTSEILWTVYLLIYYAYEGSTGRDMFSYAVKQCSNSYVLWLMYINSRGQLSDQLTAYDDALSALCNHLSESIDKNHVSACILDLLLQMFNLLCISGNVSKAIERISKLQAPASVSADPDFSMMSQILTCLTYSDKCVFWICCVYLVIYRKLPDSVVQQLEMEKELVEIEWPSVNLVGDLKQMAISLFDKGMRSEELCTSDRSSENGIQERTGGLFSLNHALCMIAVSELEKCRDILKASIKLYPACLELKLLAARMQPSQSKDTISSAFEELLKQEPKEASGIQWIWNQYAESTLQGGNGDLARELMSRWYAEVMSRKNRTMVADAEEGEDSLVKSALLDLNVASDHVDLMFGYLNLSLHNLLQSNWTVARSAIEQALDATAPEHFMHCLREHAVFQLINELQATGKFSISLQLRLLNSYLDRASSLPAKEPLSWKFISNSAEKPRVRKLVSNLLAPVSAEFLVVNTVLEAWHGPSLVPEKLSKQKELVDFVEAILGLVPCNYPLALSVSKLVTKEPDSGSSGIHFWSGLNLVSAISCAIPVAPEHIWVEAGEILSNINGFKTRAESFLSKAVSVYPMSVKLWRCYRSVSRSIEEKKGIEIKEAAKKKGISLD